MLLPRHNQSIEFSDFYAKLNLENIGTSETTKGLFGYST